VAQESTEVLGFDEARQRGNLIDAMPTASAALAAQWMCHRWSFELSGFRALSRRPFANGSSTEAQVR
jgi:hypothetical protein